MRLPLDRDWSPYAALDRCHSEHSAPLTFRLEWLGLVSCNYGFVLPNYGWIRNSCTQGFLRPCYMVKLPRIREESSVTEDLAASRSDKLN
jgi:hypothetical protein